MHEREQDLDLMVQVLIQESLALVCFTGLLRIKDKPEYTTTFYCFRIILFLPKTEFGPIWKAVSCRTERSSYSFWDIDSKADSLCGNNIKPISMSLQRDGKSALGFGSIQSSGVWKEARLIYEPSVRSDIQPVFVLHINISLSTACAHRLPTVHLSSASHCHFTLIGEMFCANSGCC